jgi:adenylosuccinate synthase
MEAIAVIGVGFGDEGKGMVVSQLCLENPASLVIRFNGGHQAGHHVVTKDKDHVFSNFGCGSFFGVPTYWSEFCTIDPIGLLTEREILIAGGCTPVLYINGRCPVTTPYDKYYNIALNTKEKHGSCMVGFGATIAREEAGYSLLFDDLFYPFVLKEKLELIRKYYHYNFSVSSFIKRCNELIRTDSIRLVDSLPEVLGIYNYGVSTLIFEGSQGLMLDPKIGFFPHVTRSNCGLQNIIEITRDLPCEGDADVILVSRGYQTRHGDGPMSKIEEGFSKIINPYEKNSSDSPQGEFRTTMLDLDMIKYALMKERSIMEYGKQVLHITCLDVLPKYEFKHNDKIVTCMDVHEFTSEIETRLNIPIKRTYRSAITEWERI